MRARLGDRKWRDALEQFYAIVRRTLASLGGREVSNPGDGFLAVFDAPAAAVAAAFDIHSSGRGAWNATKSGPSLRRMRMGWRAGGGYRDSHWCADCDHRIARRGARVEHGPRPGTGGSAMVLSNAGAHRLRGVPEEWRLYRVESIARRS